VIFRQSDPYDLAQPKIDFDATCPSGSRDTLASRIVFEQHQCWDNRDAILARRYLIYVNVEFHNSQNVAAKIGYDLELWRNLSTRTAPRNLDIDHHRHR